MSLQKIREQIEKTKHKVKIIAVSKLQSEEKIRKLFQQGQIDFAENYVQEAEKKLLALADLPLKWHFIGSLQKNKVKSVVGHFSLIHSVDSLALLEKINQKASEKNLRQDILLQVNIAKESTKGGFSETEVESVLQKISEFKSIRCLGLMTMPPLDVEPTLLREYFQKLRQIRDRFALEHLSMGTSGDYQIAIEEGATMIRLGTILFGKRPEN